MRHSQSHYASTDQFSDLHVPHRAPTMLAGLAFRGGCSPDLAVRRASRAADAPRVFILRRTDCENFATAFASNEDFAPRWTLSKSATPRASRPAHFRSSNKDATPPSGDKHDYMSLAPVLVAEPGHGRRPALRPPRRRAQSRNLQNSQPPRSGRNGRRRRNARAGVLLHRRRSLRRPRGDTALARGFSTRPRG